MPDPYMLDVVVEIAFDSGYTTPDASRTWTDVSAYVELAQFAGITFGRQDELSTADANRLTLALDNSDGRFTAGRAASPYYPNVKIGRPIRVTATPPGGSASTRFVGFVDQWPVEWDGADAYAKATITAGSRLSRLGLGQKLRSTIEQEVLADAPTGYWTLGDSSGATTASESSGNMLAPLGVAGSGNAVEFGNATGPTSDGLTAATFSAGQYLSGNYGTDDLVAVRFTLLVSASSTGASVFGADLLTIDASGSLALDTSMGVDVLGPSVTDGETHDVALVYVGGGATLYVDGVGDSTAVAVAPSIEHVIFGNGLNGVISHAAIWTTAAPSAARIGVHATAVADGFEGERTDERLLRILAWAGVTSSEASVQTGNETMTYQQTGGMSVVDALREVESTEGGVLFDGADGRVTFHNRSHRYTAPVAATFNMAAQQVESDYAPKLDRSTLVNDVTVDNPTTGETARSVDAASVDEYGTVTSSAKSVADSYDPMQQKAAWLVASYAEPRPRVPSLTVDVLAQVGGTPSAEDILALTIGSRIKVTNQPAQADTTDADYFVEGYSEAIGPESYRITFNLSPAHPSLSAFVLEDATRGEFDSSYVLAL